MKVRFQADADLNQTIVLATIVSQKVPVAVAAEELVLIWALSEPSEWADRICAIPL